MLRKIILAAAIFAIPLSPVLAANKAFIVEYDNLGEVARGGPAQIAAEPAVKLQSPVDFSGGAASSAAFVGRYIRLICDTRCAFRFRPGCSGGSAATTSSAPMGADAPEYFGVTPGDCVSVIASP